MSPGGPFRDVVRFIRDETGDLIVWVVLAVVLFVGVAAVRLTLMWVWRHTFGRPVSDERRQELIRQIRQWKDQGYDYAERLAMLRRQAVPAWLAKELLSEAQ